SPSPATGAWHHWPPQYVMAGRSLGHPRRSARAAAADKPRSLSRPGRRRPTIHEFVRRESGTRRVASILWRPGARQDVDARDKPGHDDRGSCGKTGGGPPGPRPPPYSAASLTLGAARSKRSLSITLTQAATKSFTNFSFASAEA